MKEGHRIVFVEMSNGKPFSVVTMGEPGDYDHYDFEWCKKEGRFLWSESSGSLYMENEANDYWQADDLEESVLGPAGEQPTGKRLAEMPSEYPLDSLFADGEECVGVWCNTCDDFLPWSDSDSVCDHVHWCEQCGWWSGPGSDDPCKHR